MRETINLDQIASIRVHRERPCRYFHFRPAKTGWFKVRPEGFEYGPDFVTPDDVQVIAKEYGLHVVVRDTVVNHQSRVSIELSSGRVIRKYYDKNDEALDYSKSLAAFIASSKLIKDF